MSIESLLVVMVAVWTVGMLFRWLKLPILLGELLAGLIFGPAVLGIVHESETIHILAELGIFFLMLHAGLETEPKQLLKTGKLGLSVGVFSMVLPFLLGLLVSWIFALELFPALILSLGISITAVPVTAKIFKDFKFENEKLKSTVMSAALFQDITAFVWFSLIFSIINTGGVNAIELSYLFLKFLAFFASIIFLGRTVFVQVLERFFNESGGKAFTLALIMGLGFGVLAEILGIHFVIGAYMGGLFMKEELISDKVFKKIEDRLFGLSYSFLGPIFFVSLGFHVDFGVFTSWRGVALLLTVLAASILGKVLGGGLTAYFSGKSLRDSSIIGFAMNGRGAVELILASIALEQGIINDEIFSILLFMAFFTTFMTPLALKALCRGPQNKLAKTA